jgi:hypothetical protein
MSIVERVNFENMVSLEIWLRRGVTELSLFCKQHLAMKYLLVVSLWQQALAGTTGAPSPSIPQPGGAAVVIKGSMNVGFGTCVNALKCTTQCTNAVMTTLQTQKQLPQKPSGTPSYGVCPGGRRLSESEQEIVNRIVASATVRRLAAGDVSFAYTFTATANQQAALIAALSPAAMQGAAASQFLQAIKTGLSGVSGIDTTTLSAPTFVAPTADPSTTADPGTTPPSTTPPSTTPPSTTPSQVSAAVGSQATLPSLALLLACIW